MNYTKYSVINNTKISPTELSYLSIKNYYPTKNIKYFNSVKIYKNLILYLKNNIKFSIDFIENMPNKINSNKINVYLRHDIDCNFYGALNMMDILKELNVYGSFFLLHTSLYYGSFERKKFIRNTNLIDELKDHINKYINIGLHIDPLGIYINENINGSEAINTELNWLNKNGIDCKSVVSHNAAYTYGAENFEIIKKLTTRDNYNYKDKIIPLGDICIGKLTDVNYPILKKFNDEDELNKSIKYFALVDQMRNIEYLTEYFLNNKIFKHGYSINIWTVGRDLWVYANNKKNICSLVTMKDLMLILDALDDFDSDIVFNIHPFYFDDNL